MMNEFWLRQIKASTAGLELTYPETEIRFRVEFDSTGDPSFGIVELYNLRPETENRLQRGEYFILSAGYQGDTGTLIAGAISHVFAREEGVDRICEVEVIDATSAYLSQIISRTYSENSRLSYIITDVLKTTGLEIGPISLPDNLIYPQGRVIEGRVKEVLQQLAEEGGARLYVKNGTVYVVPEAYAEEVGVLLTSETGLIRSPTRIDSEDAEWEVECILNYRIREGTYIEIASKAANGVYRVVSGYHDSAGAQHVTKIEVVGL